jgi:hypothetical protein
MAIPPDPAITRPSITTHSARARPHKRVSTPNAKLHTSNRVRRDRLDFKSYGFQYLGAVTGCHVHIACGSATASLKSYL